MKKTYWKKVINLKCDIIRSLLETMKGTRNLKLVIEREEKVMTDLIKPIIQRLWQRGNTDYN